jgi:hypothetical protein
VKRFSLIAIAVLALFTSAMSMWAQAPEKSFELAVNPPFVNCVSQPGFQATSNVVVHRGELNDVLFITAHHLKPNTGFDVFTTQKTNLLASGAIDPAFTNFGLAWYQSDLQSDQNGDAEVAIKTILLDQIFGFDPAVSLAPVNTFHLGFWFNNPKDAASCGFDVTHPTPFNGEHRAGPNAMMSVPDIQTALGPLCTNPVDHNGSFTCNP